MTVIKDKLITYLEDSIMYDGSEYYDYEEEPEVVTYIYVERMTNYLYEVQFFDNFVLTRPATPGFEDVLRKLSFIEFNKEYSEYEGNHEEIKRFLRGEAAGSPFIVYR